MLIVANLCSAGAEVTDQDLHAAILGSLPASFESLTTVLEIQGQIDTDYMLSVLRDLSLKRNCTKNVRCMSALRLQGEKEKITCYSCRKLGHNSRFYKTNEMPLTRKNLAQVFPESEPGPYPGGGGGHCPNTVCPHPLTPKLCSLQKPSPQLGTWKCCVHATCE